MPLPTNVPIVRVGSSNFVGNDGVPLEGKVLRLTQTEVRLADGAADAIIYQVPDEATVDADGAAWVDVPATDASVLDSTFYYSVDEPDGKTKYVIEAPSTSQVDAVTGMPTVYLSNAAHADFGGVDGVALVMQGPAGRSLIVLHRAPLSSDGQDGDGYVDTLNAALYGPKTTGAWGTATSIGGAGTTGPAGADGRSITSAAVVGGSLIITFSDSTTQNAGAIRTISSFSWDTSTPPHLIANFSDATTQDLGDLNIPTGGGGTVVAPTDLTPVGSTQSASPANVKDRPNPQANAIMDGAPHALSTRFATLGAAQAVFPGAAALTDEIDYWAIQTCFNNNDVVDLSYGTAVVHKALLMQAGGGQIIYGHGRRATQIYLRDGSNTGVIAPADPANANPDLELRDFSVNGNKAANTGAIGQTDGILLVRCDRLIVDNVEVYNVNGRGIHHHGLTGSTVNVQHWSRVYVHDNMHWGLHNSNGVREVDYQGIVANFNGLRTDISLSQTGNGADNFTGGMLLDHSEVTGDGIQCHNNGQDGLWMRNAFACNVGNVWTTRNGRHGIRALGVVDSAPGKWISQSNGTNLTLAGHDVWMDGTSSLDYGVTARTTFDIEAGPNKGAANANQGKWTGNEDYAIWIDDNMASGDAKIKARVYAGSLGTIRYPAGGLGLLSVDDGSGFERVELFPVSGTAITLGGVNTGTIKRITLSANCDITLPAPPPAGSGTAIITKIIQPATGGPFTPTFHAASGIAGHIKYASGNTTPSWTTAAGGVDIISWEIDDGIHWDGLIAGQNI